jgi:predicted anti-sigma-YlaC factor YlaD
MTGHTGCREIRQSLGVYVIGSIDPAERAGVDSHLAVCPECREELAGLAGLPALLRRVPVAEARRLAAGDVPQLLTPPPDELLRSLLRRVAGARRARRWRAVVAAAAVVAIAAGGGVAGGAALGSHPAPPPAAAETVSATAPRSGAHLVVRYQPRAWGTAMSVQVTGIPVGTVCRFRVTDTAGHVTVAGSWRVSYRAAAAWYPLSTALPESSIRSFQVTGNGQVLVSAAVR